MEPRTLARAQALGRLAFGIALVARPGATAAGWIGPVARRPGVGVVTAAVGARDLALALGTLRALGGGPGARTWVQAGMLADAVDALATVGARSHLRPVAVAGVGALATGSALLSAWLARELD